MDISQESVANIREGNVIMANKNNKIINFAEKKAQLTKKSISTTPIVVNNDELNAALDMFKANQSKDNMIILLNLLISATVLVTVKFDNQKRPLGMLIKDNNSGKMIQPVFTDNSNIPSVEKMGHQGVMRISFLDVIRSCSTNENVSGDIIINCEKHNITLRRELLVNVLKFADDNRNPDGKVAPITAQYLDAAMPAKKVIHKLQDGKIVDVDAEKVDAQETVDVKNPILNELVAKCHNDFNPNNLDEVINCLMDSRVLVPAKMNNNVPIPLTVRDPNGKMFQTIFGDKEQIPDNLNSPVTMNLPFMGIVKMIVEHDNAIEGIIVNPKCGITLGKPMLKKIYEASQSVNPQRARIDYERKVLPGQLFEDGDELFDDLINQKGEYLALDYESTLKGAENEYEISDYNVMVINPEEDLEMAIIKLPKKGLIPQVSTDIYIVWNKATRQGHYFLWSLMSDCSSKEVLEVKADLSIVSHGKVPADGTEMNWVLEKIKE